MITWSARSPGARATPPASAKRGDQEGRGRAAEQDRGESVQDDRLVTEGDADGRQGDRRGVGRDGWRYPGLLPPAGGSLASISASSERDMVTLGDDYASGSGDGVEGQIVKAAIA